MEVEIIPETVAKDKGDGFIGFGSPEDLAVLGQLMLRYGKPDNGFHCLSLAEILMNKGSLTVDIDRVGFARETIRIVLCNVRGLVDPLDRACFDIELVIAEAVLSVKQTFH